MRFRQTFAEALADVVEVVVTQPRPGGEAEAALGQPFGHGKLLAL
jgi:hypothetical protein